MIGDPLKSLQDANKRSAERRNSNSSMLLNALTQGVSSDSIGASAQGGGQSFPLAASLGGNGAKIIAEARRYLGTPYVYGGNGFKGIDCSGLTQQVLKTLGVNLPRTASQQATGGTAVANLKGAQPGDLLFFDWEGTGKGKAAGNGIDHVAIYLGNGMMIEAPRPGKSVMEVKVYATPTMIRRY